MIWESWPWRYRLWRDASRLEKALSQKSLGRGTERSEWALSGLERTMFAAAFSIRKLIDSQKLSDECLAYQVPAEMFRAAGAKRPDLLNWHRFDEHFGIGPPVPCELMTRDLCNLLIHSFQFFFVFTDEGAICGFMVSSDRLRAKQLYMVGLREAIQWMRYIATDDIDLSNWSRTALGDIRVTRARRWEEAAREMHQYLRGADVEPPMRVGRSE